MPGKLLKPNAARLICFGGFGGSGRNVRQQRAQGFAPRALRGSNVLIGHERAEIGFHAARNRIGQRKRQAAGGRRAGCTLPAEAILGLARWLAIARQT